MLVFHHGELKLGDDWQKKKSIQQSDFVLYDIVKRSVSIQKKHTLGSIRNKGVNE